MRAMTKHFAEFWLPYECNLSQIQIFGLNYLSRPCLCFQPDRWFGSEDLLPSRRGIKYGVSLPRLLDLSSRHLQGGAVQLCIRACQRSWLYDGGAAQDGGVDEYASRVARCPLEVRSCGTGRDTHDLRQGEHPTAT